MRHIDKIYINGRFVTPHGEEMLDLYNPATGAIIGHVRLGDVEDTRAAIASAKQAFASWSQSTVDDRIAVLKRLHATVLTRSDDLVAAMMEEYGAPSGFAKASIAHAITSFMDVASVLESYEFKRRIGIADVVMAPVGVAALITPWNANAGFICNKFATALAAGCTVVIKPSEMSAFQTQVVLEALHAADLPAGLLNVVNGRGDVVGAELSRHPDIAKISFTGSTATGKAIMREAVETLKRVTLELGGKSPTVILEDADLEKAVPMALQAGFLNSGQACIAGTRILVPVSKLDETVAIARQAIGQFKVGSSQDEDAVIGPMVSQKQWDRVQGYIRLGQQEGAEIITGGEGKPESLEDGYFIKPTIFANVTNDMRIAREEIFGPVLSIITYEDEADAIRIANDTTYGLQSAVISADNARAAKVAAQLQTGRVQVNGLFHEPMAPFGGFKQSGIGREFGTYGLEAYLEPKTVMGL